MRKVMTMLLTTLGLTYAAVGGGLYMLQDKLIFPRVVNSIENPLFDNPADAEILSFATPDGAVLNGLGFRTNPSTASPTTLVLAFGGNAHDVTGMARFLARDVFPEPTIAVAGVSYRGYPNAIGKPSTGKPSQQVLEADATLLYDTLVSRLNPSQVVLVGYSLGSAIATHVATQRDVHTLVLAAPFASLRQIAQKRYVVYPARLMVKHPFHTVGIIGQVQAPITMVYSVGDKLIGPHHVQQLQAAAPHAVVVSLSTPIDHGEVLNHPDIPMVFREATGYGPNPVSTLPPPARP